MTGGHTNNKTIRDSRKLKIICRSCKLFQYVLSKQTNIFFSNIYMLQKKKKHSYGPNCIKNILKKLKTDYYNPYFTSPR